MPTISFYDAATGRLDGWIDAPRDILDLNKVGRSWVDGRFEGGTHYVRDGAAILRPANPAVLTGLQLSGLPVPCTIRINGTAYPCSEAVADLQFDQPGTYAVRVEAWPYLDKEFNVENPAP